MTLHYLREGSLKDELFKELSYWVKRDIQHIVTTISSVSLKDRIIFSLLDSYFLRHMRKYLSRENGIITSDEVPTAAINENHLWINPEFWAKLTFYDKDFVLEHEINHLTLGLEWAKNWGWDPLLTNLALDLYINHTLLKQPYGIGFHEISLWLARSAVNYVTMKIMIADICKDIEKGREFVSELRGILTSEFRSVPILHSFFMRLAKECGEDSIKRYAERNFVLYNDITYPQKIKSKSELKDTLPDDEGLRYQWHRKHRTNHC